MRITYHSGDFHVPPVVRVPQVEKLCLILFNIYKYLYVVEGGCRIQKGGNRHRGLTPTLKLMCYVILQNK